MGTNVYGNPLQPCCMDPVTGWFRDGLCRLDPQDPGQHTVCAVMTAEFLEFSKSRGNDLSTPIPAFGFPGLKEGDKWCLCMSRWVEAYEAGMAPQVDLNATHISVLEYVNLATLEEFALEPKSGE